VGVVAVGQAGDDLVGPDRPGGGLDLGPGRLRAAEADVVQDRAREQEPLSGHVPIDDASPDETSILVA
jgi:hypothetical protein